MSEGSQRPILQLTRRGVAWRDGDRSLAGLRHAFERGHAVRLRSLLEPSLLAWIQQQIERGTFYYRAHGEAAAELCLEEETSVGLLHFLVNDPAVFGLIEAIGDCAPVRAFAGRIYRHVPRGGHYHHWHGDVTEDRLVGMSVNLSPAAYDGGVFEIRHRDAEQTLTSLTNVGPGDAILFRIAPTLEHRLTEVQGTVAKTAFAGWFRRRPDYLAEFRLATARPGDRR